MTTLMLGEQLRSQLADRPRHKDSRGPVSLEARNLSVGERLRDISLLPDIGLSTVEARAAFIAAATGIVGRLTVEGHDPDNTWVNILNAPSGGWGIAGVAYTGEDLIKAVTAAA
jgi:hypothetical protein